MDNKKWWLLPILVLFLLLGTLIVLSSGGALRRLFTRYFSLSELRTARARVRFVPRAWRV